MRPALPPSPPPHSADPGEFLPWLRSTARRFSWHSRRGRSHSPAPCVQSSEAAAAASYKNTRLAARAGLPRCAPRPQPVRRDQQPPLPPGSSGGEEQHARTPPSGARRARPASCQPAGRGGGGADRRAGLELRGRKAQEPTPPRTTFCLCMYWGYHPELVRKKEAGMTGGNRAGIGHLGDTEGAGCVGGSSACQLSFHSSQPPLSASCLFILFPTTLPRASLRLTGIGCSVKTGTALHSWHPSGLGSSEREEPL